MSEHRKSWEDTFQTQQAEPSEERRERSGKFEDGFRVLQGKREYVTYREDASFRMWFSDVPWVYEQHMHSAFEIVLPQKGWVDYYVEDSVYHVHKDEVLIIPPGITHGLKMEEGSSRLLFLFEPEVFQAMRDIKVLSSGLYRVYYLHGGTEAQSKIRSLLMKTADIYREQDLLWNSMCFSYMLRICAILAQTYLPNSSLLPRKKEKTVETEVISAAMNFINTHYAEDLTLDDVAEFAGFSRYYFSRSFKIQTGYTFKDYLCQKRVQVATDLLIHTRKSMREVAEESGFGSVATFNRVFREHRNCTPTHFRAIYGVY